MVGSKDVELQSSHGSHEVMKMKKRMAMPNRFFTLLSAISGLRQIPGQHF